MSQKQHSDHHYLQTYPTRDSVPKVRVPGGEQELRKLHQLEITSRCNLRCVYCPSPLMGKGEPGYRKQGDMTEDVFRRSLEWVSYYVRRGTQQELNLAGIGESTLHPQFVDFVRLAREAVGYDVLITFATNGVGYTEDLVKEVAPYRPAVWVSLHRPEKAALARLWWEKAGCLAGTSLDPSTNSMDWAGQVNWPTSKKVVSQCMWLRYGMAMVMSDGGITTCCYDAKGTGLVGHVDDPIGSVKLKPYDLCKSCDQVIAVEEWEGVQP